MESGQTTIRTFTYTEYAEEKRKAKHKVYFGDSREVLTNISLNSKIALMVTSPPYYIGREYEKYLKSAEQYWNLLENVFSKVVKYMEPGGKIAVNFADKYANAKEFGRPLELCYVGNYCSMMETRLGLDLWARIIWDKRRVMLDGARHLCSKKRFIGDMRVSPNYEYIFVWRVPGKLNPKNTDMTKEEWTDWVDSVWSFIGVTKNESIGNVKLALFPEELPRRLIKMYTQPGDIVLDPFLGRGTTLKEAIRLGRCGVGIELRTDLQKYIENYLSDGSITADIDFIIPT